MRIFYDVDTQIDFMNKDGKLYVPDAETIKPNLKKLTDYAFRNNIPVAGSVDRHFGTGEYKAREGELARWGGPFPDHCIDQTEGQDKIAETDLFIGNGWVEREYGGNDIYIPNTLDGRIDNIYLCKAIASMAEPVSHFKRYKKGVFFEKQSYDVFTNPAIKSFLNFADVKEAVVYGVATDYCIKAAVLGMQKSGIQCYVVEDAIKGISQDTTEAALKEMKDCGARFIKTREVLEEKVR